MQCIVCGGTSFSIRTCDIGKSRQEQIRNSKYGDCCSLACAFKKSQRLIAHNGYTVKKYSVSPNSTYIVQIPNSSPIKETKEIQVTNTVKSKSQTVEV